MRKRSEAALDAREARLVGRVARRLAQVATGSDAAAIVEALSLCTPAVAGLLTMMDPASPLSMRCHGMRLAPEVVDGWMRTQSDSLARALAPALRAEEGAFWREADVGLADLRARVHVMRQLDQHGLGEGAGYKVLCRALGARRVEHVFLALLTERGHAFDRRSGRLLAHLHPAVRSAFLRLELPLVPTRSIFEQIAEEAAIGYVCLAPGGAMLESNRRAHELANLYGPSLGLPRSLRMLADLVAHAQVRVAGARALRIPHPDGGAVLEIRGHLLAAETHAASEDVRLLVFREWEHMPSERSASAEQALCRLAPRQRQIVELLVQTGLSYKQIAAQVGVCDGTMRKHVENIHRRLGVHSRAELMTYVRTR